MSNHILRMRRSSPALPSNRNFGVFFSILFVLIAIFTYKEGSLLLAACSALAAVLLTVLAFANPRALLPFNKAWLRFGLLLGSFVNPIVLGIVFFVVITPVGVLMRIFGRDELQLRVAERDTHWNVRDETLRDDESFRRQF